ncbi:transglycosylase SLT domain-containing protein [Algiphilus sp.]|uniref:transglycosylase SLT domain-containing protein n=1 Tax=Algiphilus sp. TaxID=1872431 RepID=UPI003BA91F31
MATKAWRRMLAGAALLLFSGSGPAHAGSDLWAAFCAETALSAADTSAVERSARWHTRSATHFQDLLHRAEPWLWHTMEAVRARGLPIELAVLPAIESGFDPEARSYRAAGGLWQLMPATARRFGVPMQSGYDGRADVGHSTRAALDYLAYLQGRFHSWPLIIAAYNAGEGTVVRALRAVGAAPGAHVPVAQLRLPSETRTHRHRLLGFVRAVCNPDRYGYARPALPARPLIQAVHFNRQVDLGRVAELATTSVRDLQRVNAALSNDRTPASGPHRVWIPAHRQEHLEHRLRGDGTLALVEHGEYRVQPGDTLSHIALRHQTTTRQLMAMNDLPSTRIRVGKTLIVPLPADHLRKAPDA